jgi:Fe-S-cluster containining protein
MDDEGRQLALAWLDAVGRDEVARGLEEIYAMVARDTLERRASQNGPRCDASGRCCHFEAWGHRLYVTGLEAAYTLTRRPSTSAGPATAPATPGSLTLPQIASARARGDCPFLEGTLCTVHDVKPLACRTYYCDPSAQDWQQELTERGLAQIRALHDRFGVEYRYGEWRDMLDALARARGESRAEASG